MCTSPFSVRAALLLSLAASALPQSNTTAELSGTIMDPSEAVIAGAKITLTGETAAPRASRLATAQATMRAADPTGHLRNESGKRGLCDSDPQGHRPDRWPDGDPRLPALGRRQHADHRDYRRSAADRKRTLTSGQYHRPDRNTQSADQSPRLSVVALLAPGVSDSKALADSNSFRVKQTPDSGLSFYGSDGRGNNVAVDGGESNDSGGGCGPRSARRRSRSFRSIARTLSGRNTHGSARGGVINIVTKSGTNRMHGSLFSFFRHESMDAGDPFAITLQEDRVTRVKPD